MNHWRWTVKVIAPAVRRNVQRCVYSGPYTTPDFTNPPFGKLNQVYMILTV